MTADAPRATPAVRVSALDGPADRWARAQARLDQLPHPEGQPSGHPRLTAVVTILALALLVTGAVLAFIPALPGGGGLLDHHVPVWREKTGGLLSLLGALIELTGMGIRIASLINADSSGLVPLAALDRDQRQELHRQVTGQAPLNVEHLPLARHLAAQTRSVHLANLYGLGAAIFCAGNAVQGPSWWWLAATGAAVVTYPVALALSDRAAQRATRFLRDNPLRPTSAR